MVKQCLPDDIAACNFIKSHRRANRQYKHKSITISLNGFSAMTFISYNPHTKNISLGHSLRINKLDIHPTTNKKRTCTNQHAMDELIKKRARNKITNLRYKQQSRV